MRPQDGPVRAADGRRPARCVAGARRVVDRVGDFDAQVANRTLPVELLREYALFLLVANQASSRARRAPSGSSSNDRRDVLSRIVRQLCQAEALSDSLAVVESSFGAAPGSVAATQGLIERDGNIATDSLGGEDVVSGLFVKVTLSF
jgi:hypothetical protein